MKSAWCTRRLDSAASENESGAAPPPEVYTTTSIHRSNTTAAATVIVGATSTCHCPPGRGTSDDSSSYFPSSSMTLNCAVCERLHGSGKRQSFSDRTFSEDRRSGEHVCDHDAIKDAMSSARTFERRTPVHRGPSLKCASSVVRWDSQIKRSFGEKHGCVGWTRQRQPLAWTILFLLVLAFPAFAEVHKEVSERSSKEEGVCQSIDIRNSVRQFSRLKGCRIVEGFVQILLIDKADSSEYANISFPELREITGYLLLYRVEGLRSIGRVFPNLAVIRGNSLFINYALVAFEMMSLQEVGLHKLTTIIRGSVRFEKNPALCYVDTIEWDLIAKAGKGEHVISGNNPKNGCPVCERNCTARSTKAEETLCWNQQHCQRICDQKCENNACDDEGRCCHPSCLGSCTGPTFRDCSVCKDVVIATGECKERCPNGTYEFMNHRCISEDACRKMRKPREVFNAKNYPYKLFNGSCVIECPAGYMEKEVDGKSSCQKCDGLCLKQCSSAHVDSIASAQELRGCTHITGSLVIQIRGGKNIVKELEDSLGMIEEIDGYLKIVRSFPLISLNFLKNLRVIRGKVVDNNKYTLVVLDNQNLQELWDWSWHTDIQILSNDGPGKVFFHFNPKLCLYKIETLREKAGLSPFTDLEVATNSNGDKVACNVTELKTWVGGKSPWAVVIEWEPFVHHDARSLLGYVVYFIEAPNMNVTMYDGRDACGGDGWNVDDVSASTNGSSSGANQRSSGKPEREVHTHYLSQLKPYTQYAYYVKTYTIATERSGAQSKITYFRTMPAAPSSPRSLSTSSNSSSELIMSWLPPLQKNGNLTQYRIFGRWEPDDPNFIHLRNYCDEPLALPDKKPDLNAEEERKRMQEEKELAISPETGTCKCSDRETDQSMREQEEAQVSSAIEFEDFLHNTVYVKRRTPERRRRDASDSNDMRAAVARRLKTADRDQPMADKIENGKYVTFERWVPATNLTYVMRNLRHFAYYNIEVQACRAQVEDDEFKNCSTKSMRTYRTLALKGADNIPSDTFKVSMSGENNSLTRVTLQWDEPRQPNGLIVAYQIEYETVGQDIKHKACITRLDFAKAGNTYSLKSLPPGNYSVKVRATSLYGNGDYTEFKYFYIKERNMFGTLWIIVCLSCVTLTIVAVVVGFQVCRRQSLQNVANGTLIATVNPEYVSTPYVLDEWEVPREKIEKLRQLGNGSFGMVFEGIARDIVKGKPEVRCAVKTVNDEATDRQRVEFLNEASVMKGFDAHHVVKLLGVVTRSQPTWVIMELMVNGDLKTYLRNRRPDECKSLSNTPPKLDRILQMAIEIADGMAYLATKKFVHRDLAARNCMVAEDLTVKVGDFGMTRDVYERDYYRKGTKGFLPIRWMSPESLKDGVFSSYSDVWSYGVVLWEMVTFASQPYQGLTNDAVLRYVIDGGVMERPENCPQLLYNLMQCTWRHKATGRPTFMEISTILLEHIDSERFRQVSFYHSPEGIEARSQNRPNSPKTDQDMERTTLHDVQEEEIEGKEDSPLWNDLGNFAVFDPKSIKKSPRYRMDSYGENSKATPNSHDMNSSSIPLKAGFDDFDGVSADSMASANDISNLPFVEDSLKSDKSSPFINMKSASRGSLSQISLGKSPSPKNPGKRSFLRSPIFSKHRSNPDYENGSPGLMSTIEKKEIGIAFSSRDGLDIDNGIEKKEATSTSEYVNKSETLNNGYIGRKTT